MRFFPTLLGAALLLATGPLTAFAAGSPSKKPDETPAITAAPESLLPEDTPAIETAPEGLKFSCRADGIEELKKLNPGAVTWSDPDGTTVFLWINHKPDYSQWTFTLDKAYHLWTGDKIVWGFLDRAMGYPKFFGPDITPVDDFLFDKFYHKNIPYSGETMYGDHNENEVHLLSSRNGNEFVFKLKYIGLGAKAGTEPVSTYVIHVMPTGAFEAATNDIGHDGEYSPGGCGFGAGDEFEIKVLWNKSGSPEPFELLIQSKSYSMCNPDGADGNVHANIMFQQDYILKGPFPLKNEENHTEETYLILPNDSGPTIRNAAKEIGYFSDTMFVYNENPETTAIWFDELRRLNPTIDPDKAQAPNTPFSIPQNLGEWFDAQQKKLHSKSQP